MHITISFDAVQVSIGGQTITGPASVVVPVTSDQVIALLQGDSPAQTVPIRAAPQHFIEAPAPMPVGDPVPAVVEPAPVPEEPAVPAERRHILKGKRTGRGKLSGMSDDAFREAFIDAVTVTGAATAFRVSVPSVLYHAKRLSHEFPARARKVRFVPTLSNPVPLPASLSGPVDPSAEERLTQRALDLGIWHLGPDGDVRRYAEDETPPEPEPAEVSTVEEAKALARALPASEIRHPVETPREFNSRIIRRKAMPPSGAEFNRKIIDDAIAQGRVTKLPPGYAHGAAAPLFPKKGYR